MKVVFEGKNLKDIKNEIHVFLEDVAPAEGVEVEEVENIDPVEEETDIFEDLADEEEAPAPAKPAAKPKAPTKPAPKPKAPAATPAKPAAKPKGKAPITKDDIMNMVQQVSNAKDIKAARALLNQFGCARVTELRPENYAAFITAGEEVLNK